MWLREPFIYIRNERKTERKKRSTYRIPSPPPPSVELPVQQWRRRRFRRLRIAMSTARSDPAFGVQCRDNAGHGKCVYSNAAVLGDGRVHGRTYRLAASLVIALATDGLRPHVLPDRPKSVYVLRHKDHLRCGGRKRLADSARCVYIYQDLVSNRRT